MLVRVSLLLGLIATSVWGGTETPPKDLPLRQPAIRSVFPLGGQVGQSTVVETEGDFLDRATEVRCECDDLSSKILSADFLRARIQVDVAASAQPGPRVLYLETPRGGSNRFLFRVTRWKSVVEQEPNDVLEKAQTVAGPAVVEGRIARLTDVDFFRFHAAAGERLAFNVMAARSKAPGFVSLTLLSPEGRELAHNNSRIGPDPYLEHTFAAEGDYYVVVTPRRFADFFTVVKDDQLINWQYQLAIGRSPMLWSLYPMGGKRGTRVEAELRGAFLTAGTPPRISGNGVTVTGKLLDDACACRYGVTFDIAADAPLGRRLLTLPDDSGNGMALGFAVGEEREITEEAAKAGLVELPVAIDGRIAAANERDAFRFKVNSDDEVTFDLNAHSFGSQMTDPQLALLRAQGDLVRLVDERCQSCSKFDSKIGVKDLHDPKFLYQFVSASANDADGAGEYDVFVLDNSSRGSADMAYRLTLRRKRPGFAVGVMADHINAGNGTTAKVPVVVSREEGFEGPIEILANLPHGWTAKPLTIALGQDSGDLEITRGQGSSGAAIEVTGKAKVGALDRLATARLAPLVGEDGSGYLELPRERFSLSFVEVPQFALKVEEPNPGFVIDTKKTVMVEIPVLVERVGAFVAPLALQVDGLPEGVKLVAQKADGATPSLSLEADPKVAKPGRYRIAIRASAAFEGREMVEGTSGLRLQVK
ncbi:MAG: PPC domain-containing protein [Bryobacteraceae bacterium]